MKLESIQDIDKLPSVLDVDEASSYLIELVSLIRTQVLSPLEGAEAINNLISFQGYNEKGISIHASQVVIEWTLEVYSVEDYKLIEWCIANLVNMAPTLAIEALKKLYSCAKTEFEKKELKESFSELGVVLE